MYVTLLLRFFRVFGIRAIILDNHQDYFKLNPLALDIAKIAGEKYGYKVEDDYRVKECYPFSLYGKSFPPQKGVLSRINYNKGDAILGVGFK